VDINNSIKNVLINGYVRKEDVLFVGENKEEKKVILLIKEMMY